MSTEDKKEYKCQICNKTFMYKSVYDRHVNRKMTCNSEARRQQTQQSRTCQYCEKVFARTDSVKDHTIICKAKKTKQEEINNEKIIELIDDVSDNDILALKKQMELKMKNIEEQLIIRLDLVSQENKQMKEELIKLKSQNSGRKTIMNNSGNNNGNNNNNINNIQQNIHNEFKNEIKIVAFGKEDLSFITDDNYRLLLNKGFKSVQNLVEYIHMNQNKPENQNIYISNMRDNYILIYDGNQWQLKERDDVLQEMIDNKTDILSEKFDELIKTLDESTIKKFKRFLDEKDEDHVVDQIKKDLKLMLYNKKLIKEVPARISCNNINKETSETSIVYEHSKPVVKDETDDKPKEEIVISTYRKRVSAKK